MNGLLTPQQVQQAKAQLSGGGSASSTVSPLLSPLQVQQAKSQLTQKASPTTSWEAFDKITQPPVISPFISAPMKPNTNPDIAAIHEKNIEGIAKDVNKTFNDPNIGLGEKTLKGLSGAGHVAGEVAGTVGDMFGSVLSHIIPKAVKDTYGNSVQFVADKLNENPTMSKIFNKVNEELDKNPDLAKSIGDVFNAVSLMGGEKGGPAVKQGIDTTITEGKNIASDIKTGIDNMIPEATPETAPVAPPIDPQVKATVDGRIKTLQNLELNSSPIRRISSSASSRGIDVKSLVSNTDLLQGSVDASGKIDTLSKGGAIDQFNKFMGNYESAVSEGLKKEGISMSFDKVKATMIDVVNNSKVAGSSKTRLINLVNDEIAGLKHDVNENGTISLSKLQDAKISTTNGIDYTRPETKINAKTIAEVYRTLIEDNSKLPVKGINAELSKYYSISDYLEALHGKTVAGGRLGKYFAKTVGAVAGSHFGPLGSVIGSELAGLVKGTQFERTFGKEIGIDLKPSQIMKDAVEQNKKPPLQLPAPGEKLNQENSLGNRQIAQTTKIINDKTAMKPKSTTFEPKSKTGKAIVNISKKIKDTPNKQGGFADFGVGGKLSKATIEARKPVLEKMSSRLDEAISNLEGNASLDKMVNGEEDLKILESYTKMSNRSWYNMSTEQFHELSEAMKRAGVDINETA